MTVPFIHFLVRFDLMLTFPRLAARAQCLKNKPRLRRLFRSRRGSYVPAHAIETTPKPCCSHNDPTGEQQLPILGIQTTPLHWLRSRSEQDAALSGQSQRREKKKLDVFPIVLCLSEVD
jgi:hypothetical protein